MYAVPFQFTPTCVLVTVMCHSQIPPARLLPTLESGMTPIAVAIDRTSTRVSTFSEEVPRTDPFQEDASASNSVAR